MTALPLLTIHTDGASRGNPGPAAYAYTIEGDGIESVEIGACLGKMTNNQAEYTALVRALEHALALGADHRVLLHSDSELLVKQMKGEYRVKNADLLDLYHEARNLAKQFTGGATSKPGRREQTKPPDEL